MPRGEVVTARTVEDIQVLMEKGDSENQKQMAKTVARVIRSDNNGHRKVQISILTVSKALDEIASLSNSCTKQPLVKTTGAT